MPFKVITKYTLLGLISWFLLHLCIITIDGLTDEEDISDVGVILGNKVNQDGTLSARLKHRLDKGLQLYQEGLVHQLVVSGGLGKEGFYEGTKMAEYLQLKGVPEQDIITDNQGNNTKATALNCANLLDLKSTVIVVSQFYHISRVKLAFHKAGFDEVQGAHPSFFEWRDFYSLFREFFAYYKYLLFF